MNDEMEEKVGGDGEGSGGPTGSRLLHVLNTMLPYFVSLTPPHPLYIPAVAVSPQKPELHPTRTVSPCSAPEILQTDVPSSLLQTLARGARRQAPQMRR